MSEIKTETRASSTPVADALALVDKAMTDGFAPDGTAKKHLSDALWSLAEAVRVSLLAFPESDVRALAEAAMLVYDDSYASAVYKELPKRQLAALNRARVLYGPVEPKPGMKFEHARFLDPRGGSEKARCTVTSVRHGRVYWTYTYEYDAGDTRGAWYFKAEDVRGFVGAWL